MAKDICIFRRVEKKYRISKAEKEQLLQEIGGYLTPDKYARSTVCSLYLDTPTHLLIRNSIAAKTYKEKLRLRCYGVPTEASKVFLEIKKKYKGVVYKRRIALPLKKAKGYLEKRIIPEDSQIMREIEYAMKFYGFPQPKMMIAYEREAFYVKDVAGLRITLDSNIRYRETDLALEHGNEGIPIISDKEYIMEIKTGGAMPLWLSHALDKFKILPSSFSKYGTAYQKTEKARLEGFDCKQHIKDEQREENNYAMV